MRAPVSIGIGLLTIAIAACHRPVPGTSPAWQPRFGPVVAGEVIVGRVADGERVWLMTSMDALIAINLRHARHTRFPLHPLIAGEHVWGLASTGIRGDGFWTLTGRRELAHVTEEGLIDRRLALSDPHVAVYSGVRELVYQVVNMLPPADALVAGPPGASPRRRWSGMRTRTLSMRRADAAALNIVACGVGEGDTIPCWFPDEAIVTLTEDDGESRQVVLEGVHAVEPSALLASAVPRRPVADAWMSSAGELWALTIGEATRADFADRRGAWTLGRYSADGRVLRRIPLDEPARLILAVIGTKATLLAWDGRVVEVQP